MSDNDLKNLMYNISNTISSFFDVIKKINENACIVYIKNYINDNEGLFFYLTQRNYIQNLIFYKTYIKYIAFKIFNYPIYSHLEKKKAHTHKRYFRRSSTVSTFTALELKGVFENKWRILNTSYVSEYGDAISKRKVYKDFIFISLSKNDQLNLTCF